MVEKLQMMSTNIIQKNIDYIELKFPNAITEAKENGKLIKKIDFDILKQELSDALVDDKKERYQMTWPDKKKSMLMANGRVNATLRPDKSKSINFDETKNLYIEGDNLDVLKLLRETYLGNIKMIYIDPPYNTGNDFVYNDVFFLGEEDYIQHSGQNDEHGNRLVQNNESNGRFHTDWLNMMYPRLKVAKDLLTDDGAIFISIDENEDANLKKICEEIFGRKNYVGEIIRKTKSMTGDSGNGFNQQHELLLIYAKKIAHFRLQGREKEFLGYDNIDDDPKGDWISADPSAKSGGNSTYFQIVNPYTGKIDFPPKGRYWAFSQSTFNRYVKEGKIKFKVKHLESERGFIFKRYKKDAQSSFNPINSLFIENKFMNQTATSELNKLMDNSSFSYPKPVDFISELIKSISQNNDIILDFFSGSSTTAHSVLKVNMEDQRTRKFIMVQLNEKLNEQTDAFKLGLKNICEFGQERIRRAGIKIKNENPHNAENLDIGFRVLKLDSSNMKDVYYNPNSFQQIQLDKVVSNIKEDRTSLDLLFQVMLELGIELSAKIEEKEIFGKTCFIVNKNDIVACFDDGINDEVFKELASTKSIYAVFKDSAFLSDAANINCEQIFKSISPSTNIKVI